MRALRHLIPALAALMPVCGPAARAQSCGVSATAASFGTYSPTAPMPNDTTASVSISCQAAVQVLVSYTVSLSPGQGGSFAGRALRSDGGSLRYQLYSDSLRTTVWGDGTGGTQAVGGGYLLAALVPARQTQTAYARLSAGQNVTPGTYADTVLVTVWW